MENASKALLIAAAVLIVILLVAFGMKIFQSSSNVDVDDTATALDTATTEESEKIAPQISQAVANYTFGSNAYNFSKEDIEKYIITDELITNNISTANNSNTYTYDGITYSQIKISVNDSEKFTSKNYKLGKCSLDNVLNELNEEVKYTVTFENFGKSTKESKKILYIKIN